MVKAEIVKRIASRLSLKDKEALIIVDSIIDSLKQVIEDDKRLEIRDFGVFQIKERKPRIGRNPKNKKSYPIPSHNVVTFKAGRGLKELPLSAHVEGDEDDVD